jgi:glycosyltransferase involved in cell wall biosynthesis
MKKVLIITYYWPPSGKASLQWPLKIIKHLPEFGWQPVVLTVEDDTFSDKDETFLKQIPEDLKVIKTKALEPFNLYKKFTGKEKDSKLIASETISTKNKSLAHRLSIWIRMNLFIPDARIGWYFPAVKSGTNFINDEKIDAIVSVGPPHTAHLIGKKLSVKYNLPHIPVFIDPWVDIAYYQNFKRNNITLKIDNHLEKSVLQNSEAVIFVTETMKKDYQQKYPFLKNKSNVLYWGYSEEDFNDIELKENTRNEKILVHAGNLFSYQNPSKLWQQVKKEIDQGNPVRIKFVGTIDGEIVKSISSAGLDPYTDYLGFLPYKKMLAEICNADFLLVCATEPRHVPGKLFEYLKAGKPIIAYGDNNEEVKRILEESNTGMMFGYDEDGKEFFTNYPDLKPDPGKIVQYDRIKISEAMSKILDSI